MAKAADIRRIAASSSIGLPANQAPRRDPVGWSGDARFEPAGDPGLDHDRRLARASALLRSGDDESTRQAMDDVARLAASGHPPALRVLLSEILRRRLARRSITRVLLDAADIADAEQTTLIAVAERISSFEGRARFTTWLDAVARNEALMVVRRRQRKSEPVTNELPEADRLARRLSSLLAGEEAFRAALDALPEEQKAVVVLREQHGLSYHAIAAQLDVPVGTVRSRLNRARQALAERLLGGI